MTLLGFFASYLLLAGVIGSAIQRKAPEGSKLKEPEVALLTIFGPIVFFYQVGKAAMDAVFWWLDTYGKPSKKEDSNHGTSASE